MSVALREFRVSSAVFGGFTRWVDVGAATSLEAVVAVVTGALGAALARENWTGLRDRFDPAVFHIHDVGLDELRRSAPGRVFYVCDGRHAGAGA